jgi:hypothetical protein
LQHFVDSNIANSQAIQVSITRTELSQSPNTTPIKDISKNYEYVWMPEEEIGIFNIYLNHLANIFTENGHVIACIANIKLIILV